METIRFLARNGDGTFPAGVYRYAGRFSTSELLSDAANWGWQGWSLNGAEIGDKREFIAACTRTLHFPDYQGRNWDALEESLRDLSWARAKGYLLVYAEPFHFARNNATEWRTASSILHEVTNFWQQQGSPFCVLLRRTFGAAPDLPLLR